MIDFNKFKGKTIANLDQILLTHPNKEFFYSGWNRDSYGTQKQVLIFVGENKNNYIGAIPANSKLVKDIMQLSTSKSCDCAQLERCEKTFNLSYKEDNWDYACVYDLNGFANDEICESEINFN